MKPLLNLAPLEPDGFLRWAYYQQPGQDRLKGSSPLTLDDVAFEWGPDRPREDIRRDYVHLAARVRRNQRLGLDPWEGI